MNFYQWVVEAHFSEIPQLHLIQVEFSQEVEEFQRFPLLASVEADGWTVEQVANTSLMLHVIVN